MADPLRWRRLRCYKTASSLFIQRSDDTVGFHNIIEVADCGAHPQQSDAGVSPLLNSRSRLPGQNGALLTRTHVVRFAGLLNVSAARSVSIRSFTSPRALQAAEGEGAGGGTRLLPSSRRARGGSGMRVQGEPQSGSPAVFRTAAEGRPKPPLRRRATA